MTRSKCPNAREIQNMLLGQISKKRLEELSSHLESCPRCLQTAEAISADDKLTNALRCSPIDTEKDPLAAHIIEQGKAIFFQQSADSIPADTIDGSGKETHHRQGNVTSGQLKLRFLGPAQLPDEIGRIGHFRILGVLGQGGMGVVFRAEDTKLDRYVALKVLWPERRATPELKRRFIREAKAMAAINHENVVSIYSVEDSARPPFIVMELLQGQTLAKRLSASDTLDETEIARIGKQIACGLHAAHAQSVIHRDLKPDNIWIEKGGRVRLLDFGLARADDGDLTHTGQMIGTPQYMSPEQARGNKVDVRSDLFSLGSVLYHMTVGKPPFRCNNIASTLVAIAQVEYRPVELVRTGLNTDLAQLIRQLLAKSPSDRPASAATVSKILGRIEDAAAKDKLPQIETVTPQWSARPRQSAGNKSTVSAAIMLGTAFAVALLLASFVFKFSTRNGTVIVELKSDVQIKEVKIDENSVEFTQKDSPSRVTFDVHSGGHKMKLVTNTGAILTTELDARPLILQAGKTVTLTAWLQSPPDVVPSPAPQPDPADYNREVAKWVLSVSGIVTTHQGGGNDVVVTIAETTDQLPTTPFRLHAVTLFGQDKIAGLIAQNSQQLEYLRVITLHESSLNTFELQKISELPHLQIIDFDKCQIDANGLPHFSKLKKLTKLRFGMTRISAEGLAYLAQIPNLAQLDLTHQDISDDALTAIGNLPKLERLAFYSTTVTRDGAIILGQMGQLKELVLQDTPWTTAMLGQLANLKGLQKLSLFESGLNEEAITSLDALLPNCRIDHEINPSRAIASIVLSMGGSVNVTDYSHFEQVEKTSDLPSDEFNLFGVDFTKNQTLRVEDLEILTQSETLERVKLGLTEVDDSVFPLLKKIPKLRHVHLSWTQVSDEGLSAVRDLHLDILHLIGTKISNRGAKHLAEHPRLTDLYLGRTRIGDESLRILASIPKLRVLTVDHNFITDDGLRFLRECNTLEVLDLSETKVTSSGVESLRKRLPGCKIVWDGGTIEPQTD